jgi:hypothetical protein
VLSDLAKAGEKQAAASSNKGNILKNERRNVNLKNAQNSIA